MNQRNGSVAAGFLAASTVGACLAAAAMLAACGQKGPLLLGTPAPPAPAASVPAR